MTTPLIINCSGCGAKNVALGHRCQSVSLEQLASRWREEAATHKAKASSLEDDGHSTWSNGESGRAQSKLDCADDLEAVLASLPQPPLQALADQQQDLPPDAAKVLRDNLWELYDGEPAAASLPSGWQPIASCPKDWSWFLGFADGEYSVVRVGPQGWEPGDWTPTHWQPLPELPSSVGGTAHGE